ncbi:extracellular solute-binding protein [Alkalihalobacillus sp. AL-G]|uniref:sugar ABC transporter substrate-binding protein n=1 Tax=Alkalihalobacillus sp. AL-G TaxID=2926399 RepID=UPI00272D9982|nr:extracellular solute-binding protein [Alkalihalobacillus sp. AL-G]WLD95414.1 extracellular solute-binding protein [Alkalihalobacillus sp. AL-G]
MKKWLMTIVTLILVLGIFAGCSKEDSTKDTTNENPDAWKEWEGTITMWDGPRWADKDENKYHWIEAKKAEFEEKYPGVKIEIVQTPWAEMNDKLSIAIAGRAWPDIAPVDISGGSVNINHIKQGVVAPFDPYLTDEEMSDFYENAVEAYTHDGKLYGIPNSISVHAMLLNLDIFEEKGVEPPKDGKWTYDEFVEKMEALTGDGVDGFSTYILPGYYEAWPFLLMDGGYPLSDDLAEYTFDSEEAISGLQKLVDLKFKYDVTPESMGGQDVGGTWKAWGSADQRTVAVEPWATWAIASAQSEAFKTNFMVAEYPTGETGEPVTIGGVGGWVMFNSEDEAKKRMVAEFIKHISSTEEQVTMAKNYGIFPARKSAAEQEPFADNPQMARAQELSQHAVMVPRHPNWARIDEAIQKQLQLALNGEKTPEEALKSAGETVTSILNE